MSSPSIDANTLITALNTVLGSMAISAVLVALPKPGTPLSWGVLYKFFYDATTGFWSLKTGKTGDPPSSAVPSKVEVGAVETKVK